MILIGELSLWVALLMAIWGATVSFAGGSLERRDLVASGERAIYATLAMVLLASLGLWTAIFTNDFSFKYVASYTAANLPKAYLLTSFWSGPAGSLLFLCLILSAYSAIAVWTNRTRNRALMPFVSGMLAIVLVFFLATLCFGANPYERLDWIPPEGRGMNPELQNSGMAIHPPTLYLGYLATTIPFAFAMAALLARRLDTNWLAAVRKWALLAWFFNTIGILLGMWSAYVELGWGYWAWYPIENASLLPWLVSTALLYSIMAQAKRGTLQKWNVALVVATFFLAMFGTFITRSGVVSSVHSVAQSPVGKGFAGLLVLAIGATVYFLARSARRYGGYILTVGMVVVIGAFVGIAFRKESGITMKPGDSRELVDSYGRKWAFVSQGISRYDVLNRQVAAIALDASRDGQPAGVIASEKRQYVDSRGEPTFDPSTRVGIKTSPGEDVYVALATVRPDDSVELRVAFTPLVMWVWVGGALVAVGGMMLMWPQTRRSGAYAGYAETLEPQPVVEKASEVVQA